LAIGVFILGQRRLGIAITAFALAGEEEKIRDGGCDAYIVKPISLPNFLQTIERFANPVVAAREAV
jgi:CheY-like chemotaxis protein